MCGSMTDGTRIPRLQSIGRFGGFDLYYNPLNQRIIAERKSDLATVLFDCPSLDVARRWDADDEEVRSLQAHLRVSRIPWAGLGA